MVVIKNIDSNTFWQGYSKVGATVYCWLIVRQRSHFRKCLAVPWNIRHRVIRRPRKSISFISKILQTYINTKTCTWMYMAALFIVAWKWKKLQYPPVDEWINKKWHIIEIEYYWAIKWNGTLIHAKTWIDLESVTL